MPPKATNKSLQKKQAKIVEDKTFGLKNKNKSKKVQQYVQQVQKNVAQVGKRPKDLLLEQQAKEAKLLAKKAKEDSAAELASLFKAVTGPVKQQEVAADVDPKSVLCAYFKAGTCRRGDKCKYSHDVEASRKVSKINLYADPRSADTMDSWDQAKLESVIASKQVKKPTETDIVCKYFLDAVEKKQYGWFWECPNGAICHYRHALPPGFVLKTQQKEEAKDEEEEADIGEQIEDERAQLDLTKCTPVTLESFTKWKEEQKAKRVAEAEEKAKAVQKRTGRMEGLTGRDLFIFDPTLFVDDDEAAAEDTYEIQETDWNAVEETSGVGAPGGVDEDSKSDGADEAAGGAGAQVCDASLFLDDDALPEDEEEEEQEEEEEEAADS